jgi:hypothetical protein
MQTVLFSALFGISERRERIAFLEKLQTHMSPDIQLVAFNTSTETESDITIINTSTNLKPNFSDIQGAFNTLVEQTCPDQLQTLTTHLLGEASNLSRKYNNNLKRHIRLTHCFIAALDEHTPSYVFLWNQFNALHRHFAHILDARGISYGFFHDGLLPGSIALDFDGEMGESWVTQDTEKFQNINVSSENRGRAQGFLDALALRNVARHTQQDDISVSDALEAIQKNDRPIIFYAGQVDWHAGIQPNGPERLCHSPFYTSTLEALAHLDAAAGRLGAFIVFKPHPLSKDRYTYLEASDYPNTLIINSTTLESCMDAADIVTTIASQTSYVALMAGKSVMMLGRNQITGKGITYDLTSRDGLEKLILTALQDPLAETRRDMLADHVARLEQAYLYDFDTLDISFYRCDARAAASAITQALKTTSDIPKS